MGEFPNPNEARLARSKLMPGSFLPPKVVGLLFLFPETAKEVCPTGGSWGLFEVPGGVACQVEGEDGEAGVLDDLKEGTYYLQRSWDFLGGREGLREAFSDPLGAVLGSHGEILYWWELLLLAAPSRPRWKSWHRNLESVSVVTWVDAGLEHSPW